MKQYVLDEPLAAAPPAQDGLPALSPRQPGWWRWLVLAIVLEAVALATLYVALNGVPGASSAEPSHGIAYVASFSFPRDAESARSPAQATEAPVSRVRQERGRYLVELHGEAPEQALAMLSEATKSRVAGANIFAGSPLRLTRSAVAATPREAWQAVFGDVANFVVACTGSACDVRFVSLVKPEAHAAPVPLQQAVSPIALPPEPAPPGRTLDSEGVVQD